MDRNTSILSDYLERADTYTLTRSSSSTPEIPAFSLHLPDDKVFPELHPPRFFTVENGVLFGIESGRHYTFQQAIAMLKSGKRITRTNWDGGWVCLAAGFDALPADKFWNKHTSKMAKEKGGTADVLMYFLFVNKKNEVQMGWTPTQEDMLANDWQTTYLEE